MLISEIEQTPFLFGHDKRPSVVAVEPAAAFIRLFVRNGKNVTFHDLPFSPFILVDSPNRMTGCTIPCSIRQLAGEGDYSYLLCYENWSDCCAAYNYLEKKFGGHTSVNSPYLWISDLSHQYLLQSGVTLFKGMEFKELRTLAIDIETYCAPGYTFSNPLRPEDRIISVALKDSYGEEVLLKGSILSEPELLNELNLAIHRLDPDVIIGHNIFRFDLNYLFKRSELNKIPLKWGRNGSEIHITEHSRWNLANRVIDFPRFDIYGRHILDTYFLVQLHDLSMRNIESYGLKNVAKHFGVAAKDRTYIEGGEISDIFRSDPELLYSYNLDDVRETFDLFKIIGYPWFLQTQIFPYSFQNCPLKGNATRINALMLREYMKQGYSIPARSVEVVGFEGGYTENLKQGVVRPVVHCDVASLYPSLMLTYRLTSRKDKLGILLPMLAALRSFRLNAKTKERNSASEAEKLYWGGLQQVFKTVINSFFGYLGSGIHNFSDPETAAEVTRLGRVTIKQMMEELKNKGAEPLEVDTDGVYFKPPPDCNSEEKERKLVTRLSQKLPKGIDVEHDGRYLAMLVYKAKNYALLRYDGTIIIRGSSLKSRAIEPYLREFMKEAIALLLNNRGADVEELYRRKIDQLHLKSIDVNHFARTETLNESLESYCEKKRCGKRNRSAAFEIAIHSEQQYKAGDQISYYICGNRKDIVAHKSCRPVTAYDPKRPDINIPYYIEKLRLVKKRFEPFLPQEPTLFD